MRPPASPQLDGPTLEPCLLYLQHHNHSLNHHWDCHPQVPRLRWRSSRMAFRISRRSSKSVVRSSYRRRWR